MKRKQVPLIFKQGNATTLFFCSGMKHQGKRSKFSSGGEGGGVERQTSKMGQLRGGCLGECFPG